MNPFPHDQKREQPQFIKDITAPPFQMTIFTIRIDPFFAKIKIEGIIDLFRQTIKLPSSPLFIGRLSGDINHILTSLIDKVKDTTLKQLSSLLLWLISGCFPQLRYLVSVKNFIQSLFQ